MDNLVNRVLAISSQ